MNKIWVVFVKEGYRQIYPEAMFNNETAANDYLATCDNSYEHYIQIWHVFSTQVEARAHDEASIRHQRLKSQLEINARGVDWQIRTYGRTFAEIDVADVEREVASLESLYPDFAQENYD